MEENAAAVRRGYVPEDERDFSDKALPLLWRALSDTAELLDRGYPVKSTTTFVGNHYQLSERQRLCIARAGSARDKIAARREKLITGEFPETVYIDGFNIIITLETALSGTTLYRCMDGTVRDLAAMRGAYRLIDKTYKAIDMLLSYLKGKTKNAVFYLDAPVSNSGRLGAAVSHAGERLGFNLACELVPNADVLLKEKGGVITSDAVILDECAGWINAAAQIISTELPDVRVIDLSLK